MNNNALDYIKEKYFNFDKIFKESTRDAVLASIVGDLSYMEGYIEGLEKMVKHYQDVIRRLESEK